MKLTEKDKERILNLYWLTGISDEKLAKLFKIHQDDVKAVIKPSI